VAVILSIRPLQRNIGRTLLTVVAIFGVGTIVLGLSRNYVVAFIAIMVLAGADAVSMFIRFTIVPLATPENMRGRVLALENVFIGASNELGAFESGVTAALLGLTGAIVFGGVGTLVVVGLWAVFFPALRDVDRFDEVTTRAEVE
jgi:MFS family permease